MVIMREMSPTTLLQQLIRQREVSYEQLVRELETFARTRQIDGTIGVRHLQRLARAWWSQLRPTRWNS